jgi:hypothetical protein
MSEGLTRAQIISLAESTVSRGSEIDTVAGQYFDAILSQIHENYVWEWNSADPVNITLLQGSKTWSVPSDYHKFKIMMVVRTDVNPTQPPNLPLHKIEFHDYQMIRVPDLLAVPQVVAINRNYNPKDDSGVQGYVWPVPDKNYTARLSYYKTPVYFGANGDVPVFPDQKTLLDLLVNELYGYLGDRRHVPGAVASFVKQYRLNMEDEGVNPRIANLDKRRFRQMRSRWTPWSWSDTGTGGT